MKHPSLISILALNNVVLTKQCLESIFDNTAGDFEVCVVNQASTDGTKEYLDSLGDRIHVLHLPKNIGFIGGNNLVMERYPDWDIVLLNNDTLVQEGWLTALRKRAYDEPRIGVVGAKLLYPDGRLQEAGGEIFQDGSGRNIGKADDPDRHIYNVSRDVDYCSGACLFIKRAVLDEIGYLDDIFSPAYWEDTDLCFRARKAGWRVVYEPEARVVHLEGATAGMPGLNSLSGSLQRRNKPKFMSRWGEELKGHRKSVFQVIPKDGKDQILVVLPFLPMYDRAAGEKRWFHTLKILTRYFDVTFLARNGAGQLKYINQLEKMGITVFHTDQSRLEPIGCHEKGPLWIDFPLLLRSNDFKAVIIGFHHLAHQYYRDVREHSPGSALIVDSYDLCWVRERRKADLSGEARAVWEALEVKRRELAMYRKADMVLVVTEEDRRRLLEELPDIDVGISTDIHPITGENRTSRGRDLVFVGNYKHDPNEDAVLYFAREIFPLIRREIHGIRLHVVGNSPTVPVKNLATDDIIVTGFVPEVIPYLLASRAFVVPLRYGAGLKGKIGEALAAGIPIVTTSIGAEGMNLVHRKNAMIADTPADFASSVVEVCGDDALWDTLSVEGKRLAEASYSVRAVEKHWLRTMDFIRSGRKAGGCSCHPAGSGTRSAGSERAGSEQTIQAGCGLKHAAGPPDGFKRVPQPPEIVPNIGIVIPVCNNLDLTRACWTSVRKHTGIPHQVVVVDNGSTEDVAYEADQNNIEVIRNDANLGFAQACNQGIIHTHGDFVVILNNDTIVTPGWLERLMWHMEDDPQIGILGVTTNYAGTEQQIQVAYKTERQLYDFSEGVYSKHRRQRKEASKVVAVCVVMRRKMLKEAGLFDTRFGLGNFEDDDICLRARLAGYKVAFAKDVFIHHAGSKTFQQLGVDYGRLMEENRRKYETKWAGLAREFCNRPAEVDSDVGTGPTGSARASSSEEAIRGGRTGTGPTVIVITDRTEDAGASPDPGSCWDAVNRAEAGLGSDGGEGGPGGVAEHLSNEKASLADRILDEVRHSEKDTVFFLTPGTAVPTGWESTLEAALSADGVGCALAASNMGFGEDRVEPGYRKLGKPLARFAAKHAKVWRGRLVDIDTGFPAAVAVRKQVLIDCGLSEEFKTPGILLELQRRLADAGLRTVCVKETYVHAAEIADEEVAREMEAVLELYAARECLGKENTGAALTYLNRALASKSDYAEALYERGLVLSLMGNRKEAISDFERLLQLRPGDSRALNNLGCLRCAAGNATEGERRFREAVRIDPENWEAGKNLADLLLSLGESDEATDVYAMLIQKHGERPGVYAGVADVFAGLGDLESAERLFEMALRAFPQDESAKRGLLAVQSAMSLAGSGGRSQSDAE
jgi:GT2 family glycosyltransferase/Flp pilus assembly protein TadD/glycosyltransferase involved in cell wall biosynthesis